MESANCAPAECWEPPSLNNSVLPPSKGTADGSNRHCGIRQLSKSSSQIGRGSRWLLGARQLAASPRAFRERARTLRVEDLRLPSGSLTGVAWGPYGRASGL